MENNTENCFIAHKIFILKWVFINDSFMMSLKFTFSMTVQSKSVTFFFLETFKTQFFDIFVEKI